MADFGVASFTDDVIATTVDTLPTQRLANFQYAAPAQRAPGNKITVGADIYSLGLILNETFTGAIPLGTDFLSIGASAKDLGFLDSITMKMLKQNPA